MCGDIMSMQKVDKGDLKVVLSKTSRRFHQFSCGWGRNIRKENRIVLPESNLPDGSVACKVCGGSTGKQTVFS